MKQSPRAGREGDVPALVGQSGLTVSFFDAAPCRGSFSSEEGPAPGIKVIDTRTTVRARPDLPKNP
ncbi:hypothetical protein [Kitasatospora sp. NPDC056531]|uniref:hypothetical protein n=1 Tax=Kitasatospora sp. NPDC056531 TaxID=3345856 RepID=UPI0036CFA5F6